jgi:hypothetical protein
LNFNQEQELREFAAGVYEALFGGDASPVPGEPINHHHGVGGMTGGAIRYGSLGVANGLTEPREHRSSFSQMGMECAEIPMSVTPTVPAYHLLYGESAAGDDRSRFMAAGELGLWGLPLARGRSGSIRVLGQVDGVALQRLRMGAQIEVPARTQGIRSTMSQLSVASGNEVALVRMQSGRRLLIMGEPNGVRVPDRTCRIIAHTHPQGSLRLSGADLRVLQSLKQKSTVLISPREDFGVRVPIPPKIQVR